MLCSGRVSEKNRIKSNLLSKRISHLLQWFHNYIGCHQHPHVPGLLQTSAVMAFQPSLSSVLLMCSLLGDSFLVTKLFRLSVYFVRCLPLLLVPQIFPLNICFSSPLALFICPKKCSCLFLMVLNRDLVHSAFSITSLFYFFSVYGILIILMIYLISAASSPLSWSFVNVQHSHPYRRMDHRLSEC